MKKETQKAYFLIGKLSKVVLAELLSMSFVTLAKRLVSENWTLDECRIIELEVSKILGKSKPISDNDLVNALNSINALEWLEKARGESSAIVRLINIGYLRDGIDMRNFFSKLER